MFCLTTGYIYTIQMDQHLKYGNVINKDKSTKDAWGQNEFIIDFYKIRKVLKENNKPLT